MKILVTGGAGFIGSHIVDAYINNKHDVIVVDNLSTGRKANVNHKAEFIECDIRDASIAKLCRDEKFDIVNHHAAQMDVRHSVADPINDAQHNIIGLLNVFENAVRNDVKKLIFASSGGVVYGEQSIFPADEEHPLRPYCPYGVTKLAGEKYLAYYAKTYNVKFTAFRYANVYGPRQNPNGEAGVVAIFINSLLKGGQPVINGDGLQTRDFIYVDDVVQANLAALHGADSEIINIGTGIETTIVDIFQKVNDLVGAQATQKFAPAKPGEQRRSVIAIEKARNVMGWQPQWTLERGLRETVEYFKPQQD